MRLSRRARRGQLSPFPSSPPVGTMIPNPGTFHCAMFEATLGAGAQTDTDLAAANDNIIFIQNNHFIPQTDASIVWASTFGASVSRAKFQSPKIRQTNTAYIRPMNQNLSPVSNQNIMLLPAGRLVARGLEELSCLVSDTAGGVVQSVAFGLLANYIPPPIGDVYNFRATGTTAATPNVWTAAPLTFEVTPPVGTYAVIGAECISATARAFRLIFDGMYYRPGFVGIPNVQARLQQNSYYGMFGVWGYFRTTNLPRLEVFCGAADAAQEVYLECVRVG
jgi:hypothetical protein